MVKYHDNSWYIWANYNSLTCFFLINKAIWGWFPWNKPWFQGSGEQGSVVIIYPDPMKSPFYPCHFQFPMKSPFYPTFHHHFTQINGFDFKIQGVYSKDIPPSHQQNSHYSQQQKEMYVGDKTFKWYQMRGFDWQKMGVKKRHYDISYVYWNLLKRHLLYFVVTTGDKSW